MVDSFSTDILNNGSFRYVKLYYFSAGSGMQSLTCNNLEIINNRAVFHSLSEAHLNLNDTLTVQIYTTNGVFTADARHIKTIKTDKEFQYVTTYPTSGRHSQRRVFFRTKMQIPIKITVYSVLGEIIVMPKTTNDISAGGFSCTSARSFFPEYENIEIELMFDKRTVKCSAEYIHTCKVSENNKSDDSDMYIQGFRYIGISRGDADFISQQCFLHQIEERKKLRK